MNGLLNGEMLNGLLRMFSLMHTIMWTIWTYLDWKQIGNLWINKVWVWVSMRYKYDVCTLIMSQAVDDNTEYVTHY